MTGIAERTDVPHTPLRILGTAAPSAPPGGPYTGPALVSEIRSRSEVALELPNGEAATATLALAFLYEPLPGDVLLITGSPGAYYGIGVLHGTGRATLAFQGDVELRAVNGTLRLSGDRGVSVDGPEVEIHAGRLRMIATAVVQRFDSVVQRVSSLLSVHAGKSHTTVDGASFLQAESGTIQTKETMTVNGKQILLG